VNKSKKYIRIIV